MTCEITKTGDVTLFSVKGDIVFNHMNNLRATILGEIAVSSSGKFLVDLGDTQMLDSAGVGFIVSAYKAAVARNGKFAIVRPNESVRSVLQTVGLTRLFNLYEGEDEAIKAI